MYCATNAMKSKIRIVCFVYYLIFIQIIVASNQDDTGYCETTTECTESSDNSVDKLLFYDVNPLEGFNLRRDVYMRFAIFLHDALKRGKKKDWFLVLPPFYRLYHWQSNLSDNKPQSWASFFDVPYLKTFAPVLELHEVFNRQKNLEIDVVYMLQGFDDPFENGVFEDKWQIMNDCDNYDGDFWGYNNITYKEKVCIRFQGLIGKLWEIISLHPKAKKIMITHAEIPLHDNYGSKTYWDCRKSMKFNKDLVTTAKDYMTKHLLCNTEMCSNYISAHWRRRDFVHSRSRDVPSIAGTAKQLDSIVKKQMPNITHIFIATDSSRSEKDQLADILKASGYKLHFYVPSLLENELTDGAVAIVEQIICSHAAYFIGTHESTFSFRIQEEREIMGFPSSSSFNRFCPDTGFCEKPSKWTVVN